MMDAPVKNRDGIMYWNPVLATGVVVHFIQNQVDLNIPDWHLIRQFYDSLYNWMKNEGCFPENTTCSTNEFSRRNNSVEKLVLKYFHKFVKSYFARISGDIDTNAYEKTIYRELTGENKIKKAKREMVEKYFLPGNEISDGYFLYPDNDSLRIVLGVVRSWVHSEWKEKRLELTEFFMMHRLKESEIITSNNRVHLELTVLENQYIMSTSTPPCFLINLICPVSHETFSVKISENFADVHKKAIERKNSINKYMLALKAFPGARIKLSGEVQRVYTDTKWNMKCKRLKNLRGIRIVQ